MIINVIIPSVTERERSEFPSSTWFQSAETRGAKPKRQVRAKKRFSGILLEVPFLVTCSSLPIKHWVSKTSIFLTPIISLRVFPCGSAGKKKKKKKNLSAMWETSVWSLGWENLLERGKLSTPVFWPGEFHGLYSPWGCKESDMTEHLLLHFTLSDLIVFCLTKLAVH